MRKSVIAGASLAVVALLLGSAGAADALKSGPQVGEHMPIFEPLCLSGKRAGEKFCPV